MTVVIHYKPNYDDSFIINKLAKEFARIEFEFFKKKYQNVNKVLTLKQLRGGQFDPNFLWFFENCIF